jgi:Leucine-rich repeat (LRR) protein
MPVPSASHLNLWKKQLGRVPDSVWQQTELETLILADNNLSKLSSQIGCLKMLRMLDLGHNRLPQLPDEIGGLPHLTDFLYLHDNRLTTLPSSFANLTRLRYLNISENAFDVFPECVSSMSSLLELRLTDNRLVLAGLDRATFPPARTPPQEQPLSHITQLHRSHAGTTSN